MSNQSFMTAYWDGTFQHPLADHLRVWTYEDKLACFEIREFDGCILLNFIMSLNKGDGVGSRALDWLLRLADEHQARVEGSVKQVGREGLTNAQLRAWYKRHGFKVSKSGDILYVPKALPK